MTTIIRDRKAYRDHETLVSLFLIFLGASGPFIQMLDLCFYYHHSLFVLVQSSMLLVLGLFFCNCLFANYRIIFCLFSEGIFLELKNEIPHAAH